MAIDTTHGSGDGGMISSLEVDVCLIALGRDRFKSKVSRIIATTRIPHSAATLLRRC
jgi:hypothetical protein